MTLMAPGSTFRRQRRVSGWYARRMVRVAVVMRLSYQYQRSRKISASATKNIGMPLSRASSTTGGKSNWTLADRYTPSSERSIFNCVSSVAFADGTARTARAHRHHASRLRSTASGVALFKNCVIKPVVLTLQIVREDCVPRPTLG